MTISDATAPTPPGGVRLTLIEGEFYEEDEFYEKIRAIFEAGEKGTTR